MMQPMEGRANHYRAHGRTEVVTHNKITAIPSHAFNRDRTGAVMRKRRPSQHAVSVDFPGKQASSGSVDTQRLQHVIDDGIPV